MKKIYLLVALLMGALAFTACSDDDDDNGGGGNGGGSSVKVTRFVETYMEYDADTVSYMDSDTTYFTYYTDGKLKSMNDVEFTYATGKIIITDTEDDEISTIKLDGSGKAESMRSENQNNGQVTSYDSVVYNYSGSYLQTVNSFGFYRSSGNSFIQNNKDVETYTVSGSDITKIESVYENYGNTYNSVSTFGYTNGPANNANIDLFALMSYDQVMILGVAGKRTAKLPTSSSYGEDGDTESTTISYETKNGRVVKATMKNAKGKTESILEVSYE